MDGGGWKVEGVGEEGAHFMRLWTPSLPILKAVGWK